jgi:hypothetical protein
MEPREIGWGLWSGFSWLRMGPLAGCCVYGDEPSSSVTTELVKEGDVGHVARMRNENTHIYHFC